MKKRFLVLIFLCVLGCAPRIKSVVTKEYYSEGILKSVWSFENGELNGISREYYQTGSLKHAIQYKDNIIDGIYHTYYPTGALWIKDLYMHGTLVSRREYDEEGFIIKEETFEGE